MLKISLMDSSSQRRVIVEGKLIAPWAAELRNACQQASADLRGRELIVEMKHITTISREGENVILDVINSGIKVLGNGMFTEYVVKELTRRASRNLGSREQVIEGARFSSSGRGGDECTGQGDFRANHEEFKCLSRQVLRRRFRGR
jgi:hypothetical protein